jgi:A/G-specific adenine glycosylase
MLQQTQVVTVIPYFERFLHEFPSLQQLARAPHERVLKLWSGLGYYRRARNLHRAAQQLMRERGGQFPRNERELRALPGVGKYTAHAILSIAYNLPCFVVDGNVTRVVARLRAFRGNPSTSEYRGEIELHLDQWLSRRSPGNFNQALMELGQTVCLPRAPRCPACPLRTWCLAYRVQDPEAYPAARPRRKAEARYLATAVIRRHNKVALVRGLDEGLLAGLWNFPAAFGRTRAEALDRLAAKLGKATACSIRLGPCTAELKHGITYRSIRVLLYPAEVVGTPRNRSLRWFPIRQLERQAVSQLARKIAAILRIHPGKGGGLTTPLLVTPSPPAPLRVSGRGWPKAG